MQIAEKAVVSLRCIMKNSDGDVIEDTMAGNAVQYLQGSGNILPELEASLAGLNAGDKKSITIALPAIYHFDVEISNVRIATPVEIELGKPIVVNDCGPDCCC